MRSLILMSTIKQDIAQLSEEPDSNNTAHVFDQELYDRWMDIPKRIHSSQFLMDHAMLLRNLMHPFETIKHTINVSLIPSKPSVKITNAFMKIWEFLNYVIKTMRVLCPKSTLRMYDIAGAPGMFVIATHVYLNKFFPNTTLDWYASSLEGDGAFVDTYHLYENNPDRFEPCNVLIPEDIQRCMRHGKFELVTGDIGIDHTNDGYTLQEEHQLDIEWGQMVFALNMCDRHGIMFLKMYTTLTYETCYLIDTLTRFFERVYISKPYTSRLLNAESYIICFDRNDLDCSSVPLTKPTIVTPYDSPNIQLLKTFESTRIAARQNIFSLVSRMMQTYQNKRIQNISTNHEYRRYTDEFRHIYNEMNHITNS